MLTEFKHVVTWGQVTIRKIYYISTLAKPMATKLGTVLTRGEGLVRKHLSRHQLLIYVIFSFLAEDLSQLKFYEKQNGLPCRFQSRKFVILFLCAILNICPLLYW